MYTMGTWDWDSSRAGTTASTDAALRVAFADRVDLDTTIVEAEMSSELSSIAAVRVALVFRLPAFVVSAVATDLTDLARGLRAGFFRAVSAATTVSIGDIEPMALSIGVE